LSVAEGCSLTLRLATLCCFDFARFSGGEVDFRDAEFSGGEVRFDFARFSGGEVDFRDAEFSGGSHLPPMFSWDGKPPTGVVLPDQPSEERRGEL
jgi:hypothetical protein